MCCRSVRQVLATLETPVQWAVSRPYSVIDAENVSSPSLGCSAPTLCLFSICMTPCFCDGSQRGLEKSLLDNEAHRFELRKALSAAERQLREEEAALDGLKEENMELQGEAREERFILFDQR